MSLFFERFSELCREENTSPNAVAKKLGIPSGSITAWKKGAEPRSETVSKIADFFHVSADFLLGSVNEPFFYLDNERILREINNYEGEIISPGQQLNIPVNSAEAMLIKKYRNLDGHGKTMVSLVIAEEEKRLREENQARRDNVIPLQRSVQPTSAGRGAYLGPEEMETIYVIDNDMTRRASFCVSVSGDSMEPTYHDGDVLLVEGCEDIAVGQIGVFTVDGDGYVKKRGDRELISLNPSYPPVPMVENETWCNGLVIGVLDPAWVVDM